MSVESRAVYALPSTINPDASALAIGDVIIDPAGVELPAIVLGPNGGRSLLTLGASAPGLPVAVQAGEVPVSVAAGNVYAAQPAGQVVEDALGALYGFTPGQAGVGDGAGSAVATSAVVSDFLSSPTAAAARTAIGAGTGGGGPDLLNITVVAGGGGTGLTTINALVKTAAGVVIPNALLLIAFTSTVGVAPTFGTGVPIGLPSYGAGSLTGFLYVRTNNLGVLASDFSTAAGAVLAVNISSVTSAPGSTTVNFISP